ncbi:MAG: hypothetical protein JXB26_16700 [Candidatus Aminicenantes bacterium]|nr:hypothetical protein [Candidatus Aminicenantes bacterium]
MFKKLLDLFLIAAVVCIILGVITRILMRPIILGITAQAYVQFTQVILLFALSMGVREIIQKKEK